VAIQIYKKGQGKWTRIMSAAGVAVIVLGGVRALWGELANVPQQYKPEYIQAGLAAAVVILFGALLFWVLNTPRIADFMIATEVEMKKVNWPSRREIVASTWIVICGTLMMAALLFSVDLAFTKLFIVLDVIQAA